MVGITNRHDLQNMPMTPTINRTGCSCSLLIRVQIPNSNSSSNQIEKIVCREWLCRLLFGKSVEVICVLEWFTRVYQVAIMSKRSQSASASVGASARKRIRVMSESDDELPGSVVSAGKLLHIKLKNFMCHGNFEMSFNPRMNFVLGHNGSGKSGILTAIIIGLGGSAKATNRSNSIGRACNWILWISS